MFFETMKKLIFLLLTGLQFARAFRTAHFLSRPIFLFQVGQANDLPSYAQ
jgi:hypothetical protein